jgi:hypothetical protein
VTSCVPYESESELPLTHEEHSIPALPLAQISHSLWLKTTTFDHSV